MSYLDTAARVSITFIALYVFCRILGKKLISHLTLFDFIAGITIGSLGGSFIFADQIPLSIGLFGMVIFTTLTLISDILSMKSHHARKLLNSEPLLVIKEGKILEDRMSKARLTMDDLLLLLRKKDIYYLDEVEYAFLETDGSLSAQKKIAQQTTKNQDLQISPPFRGIPRNFIIDGKLVMDHLKGTGKDENWVSNMLQANGIQSLSDIAVAQLDELGTVFLDKKTKDTL
ncbi:DUF421 domain-containing protein [Robertmurraya beringensis]|uniref:DUF421 domain-containing protein n=1 Tax=Robertmurraya beringensis TaxID=641660 RepID=A0ABV6KWL8_9BACI|nr:Protein of uncharacterised function (DUF421) [Mycobacteroides abscessus subsp. abscessus]